ncbi:MAG: ABC transporter substrate-binding protein [Deltaproteobacteria bacterium]|nr:ABC transporter substrate-binding protein [Deltaproteobacteria bacterium]
MKILKIFALALLAPLVTVIASHAEDFAVPLLVGQTGASASFGKGETDAYTLAIEEWNARGGLNGKTIVPSLEDTQTSQQQIVTAFHRVALGKPSVILGPTWLDGFQAVIPLARKQHILLVTPSAAREAFAPENASWPITFYHNSTVEIQTLLKSLKEKGFTRPALVYEEEPFAEMIRKLVTQTDTKLVADIGVQGGTTGFQSIITNLKSKKPDVLIVFVWDERSLLSLLQQIHVQMPALTLATVHDGEGWLANPAFRPNLPHLIHTQFVISDSTFKERFKKRFGYEPMLTASNAYDAMNAVLQAYASGLSNAEEIRKYLLSQTFKTATFGTFKFNPDGSVPSQVEVVEVESTSK